MDKYGHALMRVRICPHMTESVPVFVHTCVLTCVFVCDLTCVLTRVLIYVLVSLLMCVHARACTHMCMHGAAPDMLEWRDEHGARASHYAADRGRAHVLELLYSEVRAGANV